MRAKTRDEVRKQVLGVASKCKSFLPEARPIVDSLDEGTEAELKPVYSTLRLFMAGLAPLAGNVAIVAALSTLPGRGSELRASAGDMWIGMLELFQAIQALSPDALDAAAATIAGGAKALLDGLHCLTPDEQAKHEEKEAHSQARARESAKAAADQEASRERAAREQALAAIREVERLAKEDQQRRAKAAAETEKRAAEMQRAEAKQQAKLERERLRAEAEAKKEALRKAAEAERRAAEEAKAAAKAEADRKAREDKEKKKRAFRDKLEAFETLPRRK